MFLSLINPEVRKARKKPNRIFLMALLIKQLFLWDWHVHVLLQRQMCAVPLKHSKVLAVPRAAARRMNMAKYLLSCLFLGWTLILFIVYGYPFSM